MKAWFVLFLLCAATTASAQSVLIGKRLVAKGEHSSVARGAGGAPDRIDRIEGDDSSQAMEIWTYARRDREITLWIVNDRIVQAQERETPTAAR